eukprot:g7205.t1
MAYVVIEFRNERYRINTTPMKKLVTLLEEFCAKTRTKLNPENFDLLHNKTVLDLTLSFRFANLTNGVKLEVRAKDESSELRTGVPVSNPPRKKSRRVEQSVSELEPQDNNGVREMAVFHRDCLMHEMNELKLSDEFFEFTKDDYFRVMGSYQHQTESILKTKEMREVEENEAASKLKNVKIRYCFPDGMICETQFSPLDHVDELYITLRTLVNAPFIGQLVLFTAPPKSILKDMDLTLFKAKLIPAANLYVGFKDKKPDKMEGLLKEEILALQTNAAPIKVSEIEVEDTDQEVQKAPVSISSDSNQEKRIPKWFKMKGPN